MKKVGKYLLIALLLLLALCLVGVLYLFFVPGSNLFNITYISYNKTITTDNSYNYADVNKVIVNSNAYDVLVQPAEGDKIFASVKCSSLGFTLVQNSVPEVKATYTSGTKRLQIDVTEPHGFVLKNDSLVTLYLPKEYFSAVELNNNSANTTIASADTTISGLTYSTTFGNLNLNAGTYLGSLNLNIGNSICTIGDAAVINGNDVTLKIAEGKFNAPNKSFGTFTIAENVRGVIILNSCNNLQQTANETSGGRVEIDTLHDANFIAGDTNVTIKNMEKGNINLKKSGSVTINKCYVSASQITTNTGSITINSAETNVSAISTSGNITIENANNVVNTKTNGRATINFKDDATGERRLIASTTTGSIVATGVDKVEINATGGNGTVDVTMHDVKTGSSIKTSQGNINITFADYDKFTLKAKQQNGGTFWLNYRGIPNAITSLSELGDGKINGDTENITFAVETEYGGSIRITDVSTKNF